MTSAPLAAELPIIDGKYALICELGSGGSGTVYEAEQIAVGKRVALKLLSRAVADDPEFQTRFATEARAAARIQHANVVDVLDIGVTTTGRPYFVMGLLEGETLAALVRSRGPLSPPYASELLLQVLAGLGAAHRKGIIHCDLKPANVMVTHPRPHRPLVKVLDFGVARSMSDPLSDGKPSVVLGTPMFMAPEQVCGQPVDERTDVYGASAILYALLTGKDPFTGKSAQEVMNQVARGAFRPIQEANPRVPAELASIVRGGMSRKRRERIGSVEELAEKIMQFVASTSIDSLRALEPRSDRPNILTQAVPRDTVSHSDVPDSHVVRVDVSPWLVTDSLLIDPRLPRPPARPKLEAGRDFRPLPGDPEQASGVSLRQLTTRAPGSQAGIVPALFALLAGLGAGVLTAWFAGLI